MLALALASAMAPSGPIVLRSMEQRAMVNSPSAVKDRANARARGAGLCSIVAVALLLVTLLANAGSAAASGKTITLGESLSDAQRTELLNLFGKRGNDRVITITTADTVKAMDGIFPAGAITSAFSSTALTCRNLGDGLDVSTSNITLVTPDLYAIALVTAGIGDAALIVAAPTEAPAQGMTALAGVFKTWDLAPCDSGNTTKARQKIALQELTTAVEIGQALTDAGVVDGVLRAGNIVLDAQKTIVTKKLTKRADIDATVSQQEQNQAVTAPADLHAKIVDVLTSLVALKIDWSTFAAGWTISRNADNTRVTMTGDGIAIRRARASATSLAAAQMTATAKANTVAMTATAKAAAKLTATASAALIDTTATAQAEANARATERASVILTATAAAQPSPTPTPLPTATPSPSQASGTITALGTGKLDLSMPGGATRSLNVAPNAAITRDGQSAVFAQLKIGDRVQATVDGSTSLVTTLRAEPAAVSLLNRLGGQTALGGIGGFFLFGGLLSALIARRRRQDEPFVVTLKTP